jgi:hypothetical protein
MSKSLLIMEMTGESRGTQVQPPLPVWGQFFRIKKYPPFPTLTLTDGKGVNPVVRRPVVKHHHTWTIDIPGSEQPRPAIICFKRTGRLSYTYWIHGKADSQFSKYRRMLAKTRNPNRKSGRQWIIVEATVSPDPFQGSEPVFTQGSGQGFGPSDPEVERAAVAFVKAHYENDGWEVKSVEQDKLGYDLLCRGRGKERHVEVKGASGTGSAFFMTAGEVGCAKIDPVYWLCIVTSVLTTPCLTTIDRSDLFDMFDFQPLSYRVSLKPQKPLQT